MTTLYGIKACDTMKKARTWLDEHGVAYTFHDYKKEGVSADTLTAWCAEHGWEKILNRQGTTFRKLDDSDKKDIDTGKAMTTAPIASKEPPHERMFQPGLWHRHSE